MASKSTENLEKKKITKEGLSDTLVLFKYILPYKVYFIIGITFLILSSVIVMAFPYITGKLVDTATGKADPIFSDLNTIALALIGILVVQGFFSFYRVVLFSKVTENAMADLRFNLYNRMISLPLEFFEKTRVGELTSRITTDITQLQDTFSITLAEFIRQFAILTVGIGIIIITSPKLTLMMLSTFPVIVAVAFIFGKYIRKLSKKTQDELANANVIVEETLQGIQVVKSFTNELFELNRYKKSMGEVIKNALSTARYRGAFISFIIFGLFGGIVLVLWYGGGLVAKGEMTIGDLTSFIIYTSFIGGSVAGMGEFYSQLQKAIGASQRIREILKIDSEVLTENNTKEFNKIDGEISFENIQFSYPTRSDVEVLKGISFTIKQGEKVALVGQSGAGKSTIAHLIQRFYSVSNGEIKIDNININKFDITELRKNIGIVPQELILFGGTIKENIAYGKPYATDDEIINAAKKANAWEFISKFPDGLETLVGERGVKLSGGQRQRVAIARAILKDPAILILDEATSSLDAGSEHLVQEALDVLMQNRTTIIIAHRLATIRKADKILVLQNGNIAEQGSHESLLANSGIYAELIKMQFEMA
jgi:ABC-type multidrug transport system fused ATPase/permease subunit